MSTKYYRQHEVMPTHWGGLGVGTVVEELIEGLDPDEVLISEYGERSTVAEIRLLAGRGATPDAPLRPVEAADFIAQLRGAERRRNWAADAG